jgi:hypothetical protein
VKWIEQSWSLLLSVLKNAVHILMINKLDSIHFHDKTIGNPDA